MSAPSCFVNFVHGMWKCKDSDNWPSCVIFRKQTLTEQRTCFEGSKRWMDVTVNSPRRQQAQKQIRATTQTAASKVLFRSREDWRARRCSRVTGGLGSLLEVSGVSFRAPCLILETKESSPCQGAPFTTCHAATPVSHWDTISPGKVLEPVKKETAR